MSAEQSLRDGDLPQALAQLQEAVRNDPADFKKRTFLFQLLSVLGQWDRALNQLNVAGEIDAIALPMVQTYREALACEVLRQAIFSGGRSPLVFGEPEPWIALLVQALPLSAAGQHTQAAALRESAFEQAPATTGTINGEPFQWIADGDGRLGPVLEAVVNGRYYWIPFHRIQRVEIEAPSDLRDVVWTPAHFVWSNGGECVGLIPTRYAGSETSEDSQLKLARKTEWSEPAEGFYVGTGQRMITTDGGEFPLMDVREILLDTAVEPADAEAAEGEAANG